MKVEQKKLPKGLVEITVEISKEDYQPFLKKAADAISQNTKIEGFRPGKASYEAVVQRVGEGEIWNQALEFAVNKTLPQALTEEKLLTVGSPNIEVIKVAPGNDVSYKAIMSLLPNVTLPDYKDLKVEEKKVEVDQKQIDKNLTDLQKRRGAEAAVDREAKKGDKVEIDFDVFLDKVAIENGAQKNFPLQIGENTFIPGFEEQLIGTKKGEKKEFKLTFPKEYYAKHLAGREADFKVTVNQVFEITLPELNDEFAKGFGMTSLEELKKQMTENLKKEAEQKQQQQTEESIVEKLIEKSKFEDIPDLLLNSEAQKMVQEIEQNISQQGLKFEDYLTHLKKSRAELLLDFTPHAMKRVKSALVMRTVGEQVDVKITEEEVEEEIKKTLAMYAGNKDAEKQLAQPSYRDYVRNIIATKKVMEHLKEVMVKK